MTRLPGPLLVLVATLQVLILDLRWWWATSTMVVGVLAVEALRGSDSLRDQYYDEERADDSHGSGGGQ